MAVLHVTDNICNKVFAHLYIHGEKWALIHDCISKIKRYVYIRITYKNYNAKQSPFSN